MTGSRKEQAEMSAKTIKEYFKDYGGFTAMRRSPYFAVSVLFALLMLPTWKSSWPAEAIISVIPSMLGFSLAAFTFSLGIGTDTFRIIMGKKINGQSVAGAISTSFTHFVFVQVVALFFGLVCKSHWIAFVLNSTNISWSELPQVIQDGLSLIKWLSGLTCVFLLGYAVLSAIPALLNIYKASKSFEEFCNHPVFGLIEMNGAESEQSKVKTTSTTRESRESGDSTESK